MSAAYISLLLAYPDHTLPTNKNFAQKRPLDLKHCYLGMIGMIPDEPMDLNKNTNVLAEGSLVLYSQQHMSAAYVRLLLASLSCHHV